jgi:hypothetical protein
VGGDPDKVTVSVHVSGTDLDPDLVTNVLGVAPTFSARKGDIRERLQRQIVQPTGVWYIDAPNSSEWLLADAIDVLLRRLPPAGSAWDHLASKYELRLSCAVHLGDWNQGLNLPAPLLREVAARHLALDFDLGLTRFSGHLNRFD